jgi:RNA polymerase sigma factor (sigma-70 family)
MVEPREMPARVRGDFRTTHWSVVLAATHPDPKERQSALATLCQAYWYPLYAFARRQGRTPHEAEDLTQDFFARVIEKNGLATVGPEHGRFRTFLLASLKNFLANDWDRRRAAKRGGQYVITSWEEQSAEERYRGEPSHAVTPEKVFERSWALTVIDAVLQQLQSEYHNSGKAALFAAIHSYLEGDGTDTYVKIAGELNMTEGAVKMAVLRLRENFRHRLRSEIAQTVANASEVDEELRHLFSSVAT